VNDAGSRYLRELAQLIVSALQLEITAAEIEPDDLLFGEALGLDSIDALELASGRRRSSPRRRPGAAGGHGHRAEQQEPGDDRAKSRGALQRAAHPQKTHARP